MDALFLLAPKQKKRRYEMKTSNKKTKLIDGVRYYADRPHDCRNCFFRKNRKVGCTLGRENCYYLAEVVKSEKEKKCDGCPYAQGRPCVAAVCYKDLRVWMRENEGKTPQKKITEGGYAHAR